MDGIVFTVWIVRLHVVWTKSNPLRYGLQIVEMSNLVSIFNMTCSQFASVIYHGFLTLYRPIGKLTEIFQLVGRFIQSSQHVFGHIEVFETDSWPVCWRTVNDEHLQRTNNPLRRKNEPLRRKNEPLVRNNELLMRKNEIFIRKNKLLMRKNELLMRKNEILMRKNEPPWIRQKNELHRRKLSDKSKPFVKQQCVKPAVVHEQNNGQLVAL